MFDRPYLSLAQPTNYGDDDIYVVVITSHHPQDKSK